MDHFGDGCFRKDYLNKLEGLGLFGLWNYWDFWSNLWIEYQQVFKLMNRWINFLLKIMQNLLNFGPKILNFKCNLMNYSSISLKKSKSHKIQGKLSLKKLAKISFFWPTVKNANLSKSMHRHFFSHNGPKIGQIWLKRPCLSQDFIEKSGQIFSISAHSGRCNLSKIIFRPFYSHYGPKIWQICV
jgi:hypothetical protein